MKTSLASGGRGSTVVSCGRWSTVVSCGLVYLLAFECSIVMATRLCFHDGFDETDDENGGESDFGVIHLFSSTRLDPQKSGAFQAEARQ